MHPREGGRKFPFGFGEPIGRRDFLRKSAVTAAAFPVAGALLAACKNPRTQTQISQSDLARPDNPVTLPVNQELLIKDGQQPEAGPLKLYNWEQYINPRIVKEAEAALGVKIELTTFNTMSEAISKLTGAKLEYDVLMGVTKDVLGRLQQGGLLRPLNHSYLPNIENVWPSISDPGKPFWDVGQNYSVPYTVYTTGIGYRVDPTSPNQHISMDLSGLEDTINNMPNPYDIIWDTKYKPYVHILDDYRDAPIMTMLRKNYPNGTPDVNTGDPKVIAQAQADLIQGAKTMNWKADISDYTDLPEAQSYIHQGWSGDFVSVQYYYPSWSPRDMIRYWYPPNHKGEIGGDLLTILSAGKNPVLSHQFLNFMLDFDNAMVNFKWNGYMPPQKKIVSGDQLVRGSSDPLKGTTGEAYNIIPPNLSSAVTLQVDFDEGYQSLELTPEVDNQWKQMWEAYQTA